MFEWIKNLWLMFKKEIEYRKRLKALKKREEKKDPYIYK